MLIEGYNWHHIIKTLSPNEGCYMCLIQKIKQKYVDISLREIYLDGGGVYE